MEVDYTFEQNVEETLWALKDMSDEELREIAEKLVEEGQGALGSNPGRYE